MTDATCVVLGCEKPRHTRGWCWGHYERWRRHDDPLGGRPTFASDSERFWSKTEVVGECIVWLGTIKPNGYGKFTVGTKTYNAHRWAYEDKVGPVPDGLDLDHLCHTQDPDCPGGTDCPHRRCVNPAHLEPVTRKVNLNRGINAYAVRTHCPQRHPYDEENTRVWRGFRDCRACDRERRRP